MHEIPTTSAAGCLVCLVQASDSMRQTAFAGPVATKIAAAIRFVDRLMEDLVGPAEGPSADPRRFEVGVLAYGTRPDGRPRVRTLLRGSRSNRPLVALSQLAESATARDGTPRFLRDETEPEGGAPARLAVASAHRLLARWAAEHPGAVPPIVVHCTDGETSDGPIGGDVTALTGAIPGTFIIHCLFRRGLAPSALVPAPETPCGELWAMSSPYPDDGPAEPGAAPHRSLFVNKLSAAATLGQLVRRLWSRAAPAVAEPAPAVAEPALVEPGEPEAQAGGLAEPSAEAAPEPQPAPEVTPDPQPVEPAGPPRLAVRALWMPKRGNAEKEWEDGFAVDEAGGVVAVADGAGDGIFSKLWVDLLLESFLARPIPLDDPTAVEPWIQERRRAWFEAIRYREQRWSIQRKIDHSCGAATFLGFRLDPPPGEGAGEGTGEGDDGGAPPLATGWTAWAVGDICLFHVRSGRLIAAFPIAASADFNVTPSLYQSKAMRPTPAAVMTRGELQGGDLILFATDALAQRLLAEVESDAPPDWGRFWAIDQETWRREIEALRDRNAIVNDDCTLVVLRPPGGSSDVTRAPEPGRADESPTREAVVAADVVADAIAPTAEPTAAALELAAEPEAPAPPDEGDRPVEIHPDDPPTGPHVAPEDSRDRP
jgi:hypothetical protein